MQPISFPNLGIEDIRINPVAFSIFGMDIMWYALIITTGVVLGYFVAANQAKKTDLHPDVLLDFLIFSLPISIIFARIYYVVFSWDYYKEHLNEILNIRQGGIAIYGAVIGAILTALIFTKIKKFSFWKLADTTSAGLILGQAIGRWGNFVNQEAYGGPTTVPWAMRLYREGNYIWVHPTFLYESLWNFGVLILLLWYQKRKKVEGEVFLLYLAAYGLGRAWIEGLRSDSLYWGAMRVSQVLAVILVIASCICIFYRRKRDFI